MLQLGTEKFVWFANCSVDKLARSSIQASFRKQQDHMI